MKFCTQCGGPVSKKIPQDDNRERYVCDDCGFIHYHNPNAVVGTLPYCGDKVLLCKRGIEPRKGLWTLPAGFLELGETLQEGAPSCKVSPNSKKPAGKVHKPFLGSIPLLHKRTLSPQ